MSRDRWRPLRTNAKIRPEKGKLIAYRHAVWQVAKVEDVPPAELDEASRDVWFDRGMPELSTWPERPYRVIVDWVGGAPAPWHRNGDKQTRGTVTVPSTAHILWRVYPSDRWPQCSCCGEPMPCRAELEDEQVTASLDRIAKMEAIPPGACWACAEPITTRQKAVAYPGENLDLPGTDAPNFHTRRSCLPAAHAYEERWVAVDPRRERILTWPLCGGSLIVHGDGSSECFGGVLECRGHATHDHHRIQACFRQSHGCPRECPREDHPGTRPAPRPARRGPTADGLFERSEADPR
ncbi:hypothetical protein AB0K34_14025 [Actinomadura sp. NPDC049382]|uniref:hypothetical protein n=1 Tax=Actinomadura sp. NPDC049382 TaxID=3158220 RepID=UPI0034326124